MNPQKDFGFTDFNLASQIAQDGERILREQAQAILNREAAEKLQTDWVVPVTATYLPVDYFTKEKQAERAKREAWLLAAKTHIVSIDFNPWAKLIWIERLPVKLPRGYCGGRRVRQYRHSFKRVNQLHNAAMRAVFAWSQDGNGVHLRRAL